MRLLRFARNDEKSRIPYRDPRGKPEDDIVSLVSSPDLIGGSHQIAVIAEIPSLRGVSETNDEAISLGA